MNTQPPIKKKDNKKIRRSILQAVVLVFVVYLIIATLISTAVYQPYDKNQVIGKDNGFIAVSYFGVDRDGTSDLISTNRLQEHLKALSDSGYVTITQQDIIDYYDGKRNLPEKALFLIFEDGRRDTSIFAEDIMEQYNFKATMFSYADKFEKQDPKFLTPKDMKTLLKSSFWELGTNGYRLEFINVFDRYNYYLGELTSLEFAVVAPYLGRDYNHYLMDYIRDEDGVPKESFAEMQQRISNDYSLVKDIYTRELGFLPKAHTLMHSNTGQFGTNDRASLVNGENITNLFSMNINREGFAQNNKESSIYDLTRIQPQPYWSTNHLLMRIWDDTKQKVAFVTGEEKRADDWALLKGQAEFQKNTITVTTLPKDAGTIQLLNSEAYGDISGTVRLNGNAFGEQSVLLRADADQKRQISIAIKDKRLLISETVAGSSKELFSERLDVLNGKALPSIPEDQRDAEIHRLQMIVKYSDDSQEVADAAQKLLQLNQQATETIADGATEFVPSIEIHELQQVDVAFSLVGDTLSVSVNGKEAVAALSVTTTAPGSVLLNSRTSEDGYSQRNLSDDVYDGVFRDLVLSQPDGTVLFDSRVKGFEGAVYTVSEGWNRIINWFIKTL